MRQLINFKNFSLPEVAKYDLPIPRNGNETSISSVLPEIETDNEYKLTLSILVHNNPNKTNFTIKEVAAQLNVGEEFIRRRIKSGCINAIYFGDKPVIHITELARISMKGIK
jgi:excisionase family DNA binding protein